MQSPIKSPAAVDGWSEFGVEDEDLNFPHLAGKKSPKGKFPQVLVVKAEEMSPETKTPDAHVLNHSEWFGDAPHGLAGKIPERPPPTPSATRLHFEHPEKEKMNGNGQTHSLSMDIPNGQGLPELQPHSQEDVQLMEERGRQEVKEYGGMVQSWYRGQWLGEERHGRGVMERSDGGTFEGFFCSGRAHGPGVFRLTDGSVYWGQWREGNSHGFGRCMNMDDKSTYVGEWRHNEKCGKGFEVWGDGTEYGGEFEHGYKHGHGHYKANRLNGTMEYVGQFKDDRMDGHGSYKFPDGRKYAGQWDHGHIHGSGKMEWPNGCSYDGHYEKDLKHGFGIFVWNDGRVYRGQWHHGKQHGDGTRIDKSGKQRKTKWHHGKLVTRKEQREARRRQAEEEAAGEKPSATSGAETPESPVTPTHSDSDPNSAPSTPEANRTMLSGTHGIELPKRSNSFLPVISSRHNDHQMHAERTRSAFLTRGNTAQFSVASMDDVQRSPLASAAASFPRSREGTAGSMEFSQTSSLVAGAPSRARPQPPPIDSAL